MIMKPQYHLVDVNSNVLLTVKSDNIPKVAEAIKSELTTLLDTQLCTPIGLCRARQTLSTWNPTEISELLELNVVGMSVVHHPTAGFTVDSLKVQDI